MIAIGLSIGLFYGRVVSPVKLVDTNPASLRDDYKADYVLMVAEVFSMNGEPNFAVCQLAKLGGSPAEAIEGVTIFAVQNGYTPEDLVLINHLYEMLKIVEVDGENCQ